MTFPSPLLRHLVQTKGNSSHHVCAVASDESVYARSRDLLISYKNQKGGISNNSQDNGFSHQVDGRRGKILSLPTSKHNPKNQPFSPHIGRYEREWALKMTRKPRYFLGCSRTEILKASTGPGCYFKPPTRNKQPKNPCICDMKQCLYKGVCVLLSSKLQLSGGHEDHETQLVTARCCSTLEGMTSKTTGVTSFGS